MGVRGGANVRPSAHFQRLQRRTGGVGVRHGRSEHAGPAKICSRWGDRTEDDHGRRWMNARDESVQADGRRVRLPSLLRGPCVPPLFIHLIPAHASHLSRHRVFGAEAAAVCAATDMAIFGWKFWAVLLIPPS